MNHRQYMADIRGCGNRQRWGNQDGLFMQEGIVPAPINAAFDTNSELSSLRVEDGSDILPLEALADVVGLPKQVDVSMQSHLTNEGHASGRNGQLFCGKAVAGWQFLQFTLSPVLLGCQSAQLSLNMLAIHRVLQALQLLTQGGNASKMALQQARLEPAIKMFDLEQQTEPDDSRQITGRRPQPANSWPLSNWI